MKTLLLFVCPVLLFITPAQSQGLETFENFPSTTGSYTSGSFPGMDGSGWTYVQCRGDKSIELPTPCLGKKRNPSAKLLSGTLARGCHTIIFSYRQAFSTAVNLNLLVNGEVVKNVTSAGGNADTAVLYSSDSIVLNLPGDFVMEFRQADSLNSGQVCIDNIFWTSYETGMGTGGDIAAEGLGQQGAGFVCNGKQLRLSCHSQGEKDLRLISRERKPVRELRFTGPELDLLLHDCPGGLYVAILRDNENKIISTGKLILH